MRGAAPARESDLSRQREIVGAFLAAARDGDFDGLLAVLDPDVVLRADTSTLRPLTVVRGAAARSSPWTSSAARSASRGLTSPSRAPIEPTRQAAGSTRRHAPVKATGASHRSMR